MAILKHIAVKSADYGQMQRYLIFKHDELTGKPVRNENGKILPREECLFDGINCDPFSFDIECGEVNALFHKNRTDDEIKAHHYIISFDPKDSLENGLTGERAQRLGMEYAAKYFPGHQAIVCTHMDGHNGSGNIHVHIIINSVRKYDVEREPFMERPCDSRAGCKHHLTNKYLAFLKQSVMDMCRREKLHQAELLARPKKKITEKEYHTGRKGQEKLNRLNRQMAADGVVPRKTKFQTEKDYLRSSIEEAAASACSQEEFQQRLLEKYGVTLKVSRGRFSYLHPDRTKPITGRQLGSEYVESWLLKLFQENEKAKEMKKDITEQNDRRNLAEWQKSDTAQRQNAARQQTMGIAASADHSTMDETVLTILSIKSDLRLVVDLQNCIKAQQSAAYAQKVKLSNLKQMALTVAYVQEHGYDTRESLGSASASAKKQAAASSESLKATESRLKQVNEQIHYTGQYLANRPVYEQFLNSKNKGKFRREHADEITLYEAAVKFLKGQTHENPSGQNTPRKLPSMKLLKSEKEKLLEEKKAKTEQRLQFRRYEKELETVCSNVDAILGRLPERRKNRGQEIL